MSPVNRYLQNLCTLQPRLQNWLLCCITLCQQSTFTENTENKAKSDTILSVMCELFDYTGQPKNFEMVSRHQTAFLSNLTALDLKMTLLFLG